MAELKTIIIPDVSLPVGDGQPELDFRRFAKWLVTTHPRYNTDADGIRAAARLDRLLDDEALAEIVLDTDDWQRLRDAAEKPHGGYPIRPAHRMLPIVEAIVEAKGYKPQKKNSAGKALAREEVDNEQKAGQN